MVRRSSLAAAAAATLLRGAAPPPVPPAYDPACTFTTKVELVHSLKDYPEKVRKAALKIVEWRLADRGEPYNPTLVKVVPDLPGFRFVQGGRIVETNHWFIWFEGPPEYGPYMYIFTFDAPEDIDARITYNGNNWERKAPSLCAVTEGVDSGYLSPR